MDYDFKITEAKREAVPPLIALWSMSGGGKTFSALLLARGIVGPKGKITVIDTENGRAKFYASVSGPWHHLDLQPPFTPEKYSAAFKYCEQQGSDIIIVDSASHVWEGEGGVLDSADRVDSKGLAKWKAPKMAHKRMMNSLTRSPIPVIFTLRAKEAVRQAGNQIVSDGIKPICEKNFIYEMTLALHMTRDGSFDLQTSKAIPADLRGAIRHDSRVNEDMGRAIGEWMGTGETVDPETLKLRRDGQEAAMQGVKAYTDWLATLKPAAKEKVREYHRGWTQDARSADAPAPETASEKPQTDASYLDDGADTCKTCKGTKEVTEDDGAGQKWKEPCPSCVPSKHPVNGHYEQTILDAG